MLKRKFAGLLVAPIFGLLSLIIPILIWPPSRRRDAPLFPLLSDAVEGVGWQALVLLLASGCLLGWFTTNRALSLGAATIAALPIAAMLEMVKDPTSHNLFPLEFAVYAFYGMLVTLSALGARRLRGDHGGRSSESHAP